MIITTAQLKTLDNNFVDQIVRRVSNFLDTRCDLSRPYDGSQPLPAGKTRDQIVRDLIVRARRDFGIECERGMTQFVILGIGYSRQFYEIPAVEEILKQPGSTPSHRIQTVLDGVVRAEMKVH